MLTAHSLHHAWSGVLLGGHLLDLVKDVSASHLRAKKKTIPLYMIDIPQYHFPRSAICTLLTKVLLLGFHRA